MNSLNKLRNYIKDVKKKKGPKHQRGPNTHAATHFMTLVSLSQRATYNFISLSMWW